MSALIAGLCAPLLKENISTDLIAPSADLIRTSRTGLGDAFLRSWRYDQKGLRRQDFILNEPEYKDAKILLGGANFGCGSSREHAVWAIMEYGFTAVLAESFHQTFATNALRNGFPALTLPVDVLQQIACQCPIEIAIDLELGTIDSKGERLASFQMDEAQKLALVDGQDDLTVALKYTKRAAEHYATSFEALPWLVPSLTGEHHDR